MDDLQPRRKRQKRQLACTRCRLKKTACDGRRPACSSCTLKGLQDECFYQESIHSLSASATSGAGQPSATPTTADVLLADDTPCLSIGRWPTGAKVDDAVDQNHAQPPGNTTMSHHYGVLIPSSPRAESAYGSSSNSAFLREIIVAADLPKEPLRPSQATAVPTVLGFSTSRASSPDSHSRLLMLPEPGLADEFLQSYWKYVHPVFPILHQPTLTAQYQALLQAKRKSRTSADAICQATLSITLALGAQRTESVSTIQRNQLADELYKQSCKLVCVDFLDESSISVVQLLLLRGIYLHYSTHADRCWNTIGVALRVAQGLGLNTENSKVKETNQLKREMRRRVWHNCITLDRLIAATFGRAPLLPRESSTPLPDCIDDEHLLQVGFGIQPLARPSRISFFVHSMEIIGILYDVLASLYQNNEHCIHKGEHLPDESPEKIVVLATRIDNFEQHLPDFLKMEADLSAFDEDLTNCFQMQANILKSRVLWTRLLLLRPSLLAETKRRSSFNKAAASNSRLGDSVRQAIHQLCLETAHALLQEMHDRLGSLLQNSAWHVILFTFAAASTLVAATLCPGLHVDLTEGMAKLSWERSQQIFEYYQAQLPWAAKGIQALQSFRSSVETFKQREDASSKEPAVNSQALDRDMTANDAIVDNLFDSDWFNEAWFNSQETDTLTFSNSLFK